VLAEALDDGVRHRGATMALLEPVDAAQHVGEHRLQPGASLRLVVSLARVMGRVYHRLAVRTVVRTGSAVRHGSFDASRTG
jgi:hypothetical protein